MIDNEARFAQLKDSLIIDTKPHGRKKKYFILFFFKLQNKFLFYFFIKI
jgi:hypothetical protein